MQSFLKNSSIPSISKAFLSLGTLYITRILYIEDEFQAGFQMKRLHFLKAQTNRISADLSNVLFMWRLYRVDCRIGIQKNLCFISIRLWKMGANIQSKMLKKRAFYVMKSYTILARFHFFTKRLQNAHINYLKSLDYYIMKIPIHANLYRLDLMWYDLKIY